MEKKTVMEAYVREAYEKGAFTGAWLYAEKGKIVTKGALGFRDRENTLPIREDSVFDIASITKQFTAAAVMLLRRRGLLDLEDEITRFFPELPYPGITVRHLLTHTSGFSDIDEYVTEIAETEGAIPDSHVILRVLTENKPELSYPTGAGCEYTDTGYQLLAEIIEKVSGAPFETFLQKEVFEPAGLVSTRVYHRRKDHVDVPNLAQGLVLERGEYVRPEDSGDRGYYIPLDGMNGNTAVHSNILDLYRWDRVLREGSLLTQEEQTLMYAPARFDSGEIAHEEGDEDAYGFGWVLLEDETLGRVACHSGYVPGYTSWLARYLDADAVLIQLCCRDAANVRAAQAFDSGMEAIVRGMEPEPILSIEDVALKEPDKTKWDSFCGKYEKGVEDFPLEEVYRKDDALYARLTDGEDSWEYRLYPLGENTFGRKGGSIEITFGEDCFIVDDETYKKL